MRRWQPPESPVVVNHEPLTAAEAAENAAALASIAVFTSSTNGLVPASGGGTANFLRADGTWAVPAGGGGGGNLDDTLAALVLL